MALTSDHTVDNLPYGASKGALDRIVLAAARELAHLKITSDVVNPVRSIQVIETPQRCQAPVPKVISVKA